jgi:hypothetical protein
MGLSKRFFAILALGAGAVLVSACGGGGSSGNGNGSSGGGSGGGSSGGGATGFGCSQSVAGNQFCYVYSNLTSSQVMAEQQACTMASGSVVMSCPSAGRIGCCAVTMGGMSVDECYYFGDASTDSQACTMSGGTWSAM